MAAINRVINNAIFLLIVFSLHGFQELGTNHEAQGNDDGCHQQDC